MGKRTLFIGLPVLLLLSLVLYQVYYSRPLVEVKPEIESVIDQQFHNAFDIVRIKDDYSKDLFHQPVGYKVWFKDRSGLEFGPVFM